MTILLSKQNRYGYCALKNPAEEEKSDKKIQNEAQKDEMREENTKKYSQKTWEKRCNICVIGIPERRMRIRYMPLLKK